MNALNLRSVFTLMLLLSIGFVPPMSFAQDDGETAEPAATDPKPPEAIAIDLPAVVEAPPSEATDGEEEKQSTSKYAALLASLTIFVLAVFVGFEVITKVPPTLHTPLMSGSNAISGITIVGALLATGFAANWFVAFVGMIALALATINVVGGFLVTHRMLEMFKKKK